MKEQTVINIKNVSKAFKIYHDKPLTLKEKILRLRSNEHSEFLAVNNLSLEIKKGETVGLIGHNGCGKSTLLKLITKILYPDSGEIIVDGRISSLIELGAGFHPDFTGRENIYTNASIFGLSRKEINEKIDEIIEFSELGGFIENPVRTYSSGMYMRLAFSVAINVNPEILLIDEILSVGDENFQKKCFEKIKSFKLSGATIVIVTHDLGTVEKICDRVVWINKGIIVEQGASDRVVNLYQQHMNEKFVEQKQIEFKKQEKQEKQEKEIEIEESQSSNVIGTSDESTLTFSDDVRWGSREVEITEARMINKHGESTNVITAGESVTVEIDYKINSPQKEYIFGMGFYTEENVLLYGNNTQIDKMKITNMRSKGTVKFVVQSCNLLSGKYKLNVAVVEGNHRALDFIKYYMEFTVVSRDRSVGLISIDHHWELD
ncbi:ABC transporter ATP-binding protein [Paenibacillus sp. 481]|uniref:ABC transporter ATP-binding protein n=1 Tax=Paenibacillus sp. 481 TaxID=2835869 RepID=UPI001E38BD48|nr:ABC transporter ATP-binding protein [Paenibacillus sp. 481]UHA71654.1 ABC transporter ATP-binding protein [Paenibacillus sp. 481]